MMNYKKWILKHKRWLRHDVNIYKIKSKGGIAHGEIKSV